MAGTGLIRVETARLDSTAAEVDNLANDYEKEYNALYSTVDQLKASFDGADYDAFATQIAGFKDDFQRMTKLMRDYADYLRKTASTYRETQSELVNQAKSLSTGN